MRRQIDLILIAVVTLACSASCASVDYSSMGEPFDPCRTECEQELSKLDVSVPCLLFNKEAMRQYDGALQKGEEIGYMQVAAQGGCGCLTAVVSSEGRLTGLQVVYSNSAGALALFRAKIDQIELGPPLESCLVGAVFPMVFGNHTKSSVIADGRRHTIYPMYEFISDEALHEVSGIVSKRVMGWSSLNVNFGVLYVDEDRYLAEASTYCLPSDNSIDIDIKVLVNGEIEKSDMISANRITVNACMLSSLYLIHRAQVLALMNLASAESQP